MTTVTPVNPRASVSAVPVENMDFDGPVPAGVFEFYRAYGDAPAAPPKGILFGCPCGCGSMMSVDFAPRKGNRPVWDWDGNEARPTLTPRIKILQFNDAGQMIGEHWHGFLTAGEFRSC